MPLAASAGNMADLEASFTLPLPALHRYLTGAPQDAGIDVGDDLLRASIHAIAGVECLLRSLLEDAVGQYLAQLAAHRRLKEGRVTCQMLQLALHQDRLAPIVAGGDAAPFPELARLVKAFMDSATQAILAGDSNAASTGPKAADVSVAGDGDAALDEASTNDDAALAAALATPTPRGTMDSNSDNWQKRRSDIVTDVETSTLLMHINPAFHLAPQALTFISALARWLLECARSTPGRGESRVGEDGKLDEQPRVSLDAVYAVCVPSVQRAAEEVETVAWAVYQGTHTAAATCGVRVNFQRGALAPFASHTLHVSRLDTFHDHFEAACKAHFLERREWVFVHMGAPLEDLHTPADTRMDGKVTVTALTKAAWDNARREQARRGVLTSTRGNEDAVKAMKARASSRIVSQSAAGSIPTSIGSKSAVASASVEEVVAGHSKAADAIAGGSSKQSKRVAPTAQLVPRSTVSAAAVDAPASQEAASYIPIAASSSTRLPVLSQGAVAALTHAPAPAASLAAQRRLLKTPATSTHPDVSALARVPEASSRADFGARFQKAPAHVNTAAPAAAAPVQPPARSAKSVAASAAPTPARTARVPRATPAATAARAKSTQPSVKRSPVSTAIAPKRADKLQSRSPPGSAAASPAHASRRKSVDKRSVLDEDSVARARTIPSSLLVRDVAPVIDRVAQSLPLLSSATDALSMLQFDWNRMVRMPDDAQSALPVPMDILALSRTLSQAHKCTADLLRSLEALHAQEASTSSPQRRGTASTRGGGGGGLSSSSTSPVSTAASRVRPSGAVTTKVLMEAPAAAVARMAATGSSDSPRDGVFVTSISAASSAAVAPAVSTAAAGVPNGSEGLLAATREASAAATDSHSPVIRADGPSESPASAVTSSDGNALALGDRAAPQMESKLDS